MEITEKIWGEYVGRLARINEEAGRKMAEYLNRYGTQDVDALIVYAAALVQKYGEGSAELACQMYDAIAEASGIDLPPAEPAEPADYGETAKMVNGTLHSLPLLQGGVSRLVKRTGADTTLKNAIRDGAEWAWVPHGDTCPFCLTLASRGWQRASKKALKDGHAEHIHAHCNCEYAIRFDSRTTVAGYDPEKYLKQYYDEEGYIDLNDMRRAQYAKNKDKINAQKRAAYAARKRSTNGEGPDRIKEIKDTMTKQVLSLPESAQEVLQKYTGFTATRINFAIRNGKITPRIQESIDELDSALAPGKMPQSVTLYRNTALSFLGFKFPENPTEQELQSIIQSQGTFPIFLSTSFQDLHLPGRDTVIQMHIPQGYTGCQYLRPVALPKFKNQDEVLFGRGMQYQIQDAYIEDGRYFLEIEVLSDV